MCHLVLLADNVGFQQAQAFHVPCRQMITVVYLLPDNHTDKVQPVDARFEREDWRGNADMVREIRKLTNVA